MRRTLSRTLSFLLLLSTVAACNSTAPDAPTGPVDTQLVLGPGQTSDVANAGIRVRFVGVTGDSRCPGDAICIQGGDAVVRIEVLPASGGPVPYDLHTGDLKPVQHNDLTIALVQLMPYPFASLPPIGPNDYRATIRVTR